MAVSQSVSLTQGTQSIANNTTQVTFTWKSTQSGQSWNGYTKTAYYYVSINGGAETKYSVSYTLPQNSTTTIASKTFTVKHNDNGTGSISVRTYMETGISAGTIQKSTSLTLTTIPRSSKIDSFTGTNIAGSFNVKYTSYYSGFTNKLRISIPNVKALETFSYTSGNSFTLSQATLDYLYSYTSSTDKVKLGAVIETWNGSTKIGESSELVHDCYVPSSVKPTLGPISLDPVNITTSDGTSRNILVKGKNKMTVSVSGCKPGTGSSIKSYTFSVLSGSTVIATTTTTSTSASFGPFSKVGALKFRLSVTDKRGRTADNNGDEPTWECYDYEAPYFSTFNAYRANSDGSENVNGTYLKCSYTQKYSSVNSTNSVTVKVNYGSKTSSSTLIDLGENSATYQVYLTITDNYGGTNKSSAITVFGQSRILNITSDGTGIALGKMAESNELFECRWPAKFNDTLTVGTSTQSAPPSCGLGVHDLRDAEITPSSFGDRSVNFYFDQILPNDSTWYSVMHMKGWTGDYAAWELAGNANNSLNDHTLKYRQGRGNEWYDWQTVLTNKNIGNYALSPSGATMTGTLSLGSGLWYDNKKPGLNCQNSDIAGVNAIYFQDASDTPGEAINFYRGNEYWDTLYSYNGVLKFHPNRGTSTALGGYAVMHGNNFRTGTCTLYTSGSGTTVNFSSTMPGTPVIMLTPLTSTSGALPPKVLSRSASGFTAIIGGDAIAAGTAITFMYLALYN